MSEKLITLSNLATFKEQIENEIGSSTGLPDTTPVIALTSSSITLTFNEGVLPTHIKLSNGIIVDLQGNEYCAEGNETVSQSISNGKIVIVVNGDFSELASVTMTNLIWTLISNTTNFSFNDLPRFSDSSDVADFPGSSGGEGSGGSGKLYGFSFTLSSYDENGTVLTNQENVPYRVYYYEQNFDRLKAKLNTLSNNLHFDTPQELVDLINNGIVANAGVEYNDVNWQTYLVISRFIINLFNESDFAIWDGYSNTNSPIRAVATGDDIKLLGLSDNGNTIIGLSSTTQQEYLCGLNVNNSCTLTEYGTSASGGSSSGSDSSASEYPKVKEINLNNYLTDAQVLQFLQVYQQGTGNAFLTTSSDFMTSAEFEEYDMIRAKAYVSGTLAFDGLLQKQVSTPAKAYGISFGKVASSFANCCHIYFYMGSSSGNDTMSKIGICATSLS